MKTPFARIGLALVLSLFAFAPTQTRAQTAAQAPTQAPAQAQDVAVWVYHNFPPYVVDPEEKTGLSYDLARMLTEMSDGQYHFRVNVLPRQRLNERLNAGDAGLVLWANNTWFGDPDRTRYVWTAPLLNDTNTIISPTDVAFEYDGPQSLVGMTLVGVRGHFYSGVDMLVDDGLVSRLNVRAEENLVQFIASGRGSVAIVAHSAAQYFVESLRLDQDVHFARTPHSRYQRYILIQSDQVPLHDFVRDAVLRLKTSAEWRAIADTYGLSADLVP